MKKFFIETYTFVKEAGSPLSKNPLQWSNGILEVLYTTYPQLATQPQSISFNSKNEDNGSAAGQITVGPLHIPFVIDNFKLSSLLVGFLGDQPITTSMPLTELYLEKIFSPQSFYKRLTKKAPKKQARVSMSTTIVKDASLLDILSGQITKEAKLSLLKEIQADDRLIATLHKNDHQGFITKIANMGTLKEEEIKDEAVETDIEYIYKESSLGWTKLSGVIGSTYSKKEYLAEHEANSSSTTTPNKHLLIKKAEKSNSISYKDTVYKAVDLDKDLSSRGHLFVSSDGNYIEDFSKNASWEFTSEEVSFKDTEARPKDSVLIKVGNNEFIGPVRVISTYAMEKEGQVLHGVTNFEKIAVVENSKLSNAFYDSKDHIAYVPKIEIIKLASKINTVSENKAPRNIVSIHNNDYHLIGPDFSKEATHTLTKDEAIWSLLQHGATDAVIEKVASVTFGDVNIMEKLEVPHEKEASISTEGLNKFIDENFRGFLKEAASIADKNSLDVILGLNMVTEDNVVSLIQSIPVIDGALNSLSKLFLLSSVGLRSFDLGSIESILVKLGKVRDTLESLTYMLKK